jgi:hypothetical protein
MKVTFCKDREPVTAFPLLLDYLVHQLPNANPKLLDGFLSPLCRMLRTSCQGDHVFSHTARWYFDGTSVLLLYAQLTRSLEAQPGSFMSSFRNPANCCD